MWKEVQSFFNNQIKLPHFTLQGAIFGFLEATKEDYMLTNIILLTFKITLYKKMGKHLSLISIINNISKR